MDKKLKFIDLFCGAGDLSLGIKLADFVIVDIVSAAI